jgi:ankyrin repeat protein
MGHLEIVTVLLASGAKVNAQGEDFPSGRYPTQPRPEGGDYGTALQAAAAHGDHPEIIKLLLENGADVNAQGEDCGE